MRTPVILILAAAAMPLGACASAASDSRTSSASAADPLASAAIGSPVEGVAGGVWADRDNDGRVDGYVRDGQYHAGMPSASRTAEVARDCRAVGGTALTGAGLGAGAGVDAVAGGGVPGGALVGAAVGGLAGAAWADANNDGCVDGYIRDGQYHEGSPHKGD